MYRQSLILLFFCVGLFTPLHSYGVVYTYNGNPSGCSYNGVSPDIDCTGGYAPPNYEFAGTGICYIFYCADPASLDAETPASGPEPVTCSNGIQDEGEYGLDCSSPSGGSGVDQCDAKCDSIACPADYTAVPAVDPYPAGCSHNGVESINGVCPDNFVKAVSGSLCFPDSGFFSMPLPTYFNSAGLEPDPDAVIDPTVAPHDPWYTDDPDAVLTSQVNVTESSVTSVVNPDNTTTTTTTTTTTSPTSNQSSTSTEIVTTNTTTNEILNVSTTTTGTNDDNGDSEGIINAIDRQRIAQVGELSVIKDEVLGMTQEIEAGFLDGLLTGIDTDTDGELDGVETDLEAELNEIATNYASSKTELPSGTSIDDSVLSFIPQTMNCTPLEFTFGTDNHKAEISCDAIDRIRFLLSYVFNFLTAFFIFDLLFNKPILTPK